MASRACAKKLLDCSQMVIGAAECVKQTIWLRQLGRPSLNDDETEKAAELLLEAFNLTSQAQALLAEKLE